MILVAVSLILLTVRVLVLILLIRVTHILLRWEAWLLLRLLIDIWISIWTHLIVRVKAWLSIEVIVLNAISRLLVKRTWRRSTVGVLLVRIGNSRFQIVSVVILFVV